MTYNHAPFIDQALESALGQRTAFPFEVLVGDDGSTDGTRDIIRRYADHDRRLRPVFHPHNLGGHGSGNFLRITSLAAGEYLSILEGDDLFTDPGKLQLQSDFLDREEDCAGCFHDCAVIDAAGTVIEPRYELKVRGPRVSQGEIIRNGNNSVTNTRMYRRQCVDHYPTWYLNYTIDWGLEILVAARGPWGFINRNMSAYRLHGSGLFSSASLRRRHEMIIGMAKVLLNEPSFAPYRGALRGRLAWMHREIAHACRSSADRREYLRNLLRFVRYAPKNLGLLKSLARELVE